MDNEMVERVALAISGSDDPANILSIHRDRARLAIKAMREPLPSNELLMLADRLETLPSYSGYELGAVLFHSDKPKVFSKEMAVILIDNKWRSSLVAALRNYANINHD